MDEFGKMDFGGRLRFGAPRGRVRRSCGMFRRRWCCTRSG